MPESLALDDPAGVDRGSRKRQRGLALLEEVKASDSRFLEVEVARLGVPFDSASVAVPLGRIAGRLSGRRPV